MANATKNMTVKAGNATANVSANVSDSMPGVPCPNPAGYTYTGMRYVPVFADPAEWNINNSYEALEIVLHEGNSYTSKIPVPVGIDIENSQYWALTGNFNAQLEQYRIELEAAKKNIQDIEDKIQYYAEDIGCAANDPTVDCGAAITAFTSSGNEATIKFTKGNYNIMTPVETGECSIVMTDSTFVAQKTMDYAVKLNGSAIHKDIFVECNGYCSGISVTARTYADKLIVSTATEEGVNVTATSDIEVIEVKNTGSNKTTTGVILNCGDSYFGRITPISCLLGMDMHVKEVYVREFHPWRGSALADLEFTGLKLQGGPGIIDWYYDDAMTYAFEGGGGFNFTINNFTSLINETLPMYIAKIDENTVPWTLIYINNASAWDAKAKLRGFNITDPSSTAQFKIVCKGNFPLIANPVGINQYSSVTANNVMPNNSLTWVGIDSYVGVSPKKCVESVYFDGEYKVVPAYPVITNDPAFINITAENITFLPGGVTTFAVTKDQSFIKLFSPFIGPFTSTGGAGSITLENYGNYNCIGVALDAKLNAYKPTITRSGNNVTLSFTGLTPSDNMIFVFSKECEMALG